MENDTLNKVPDNKLKNEKPKEIKNDNSLVKKDDYTYRSQKNHFNYEKQNYKPPKKDIYNILENDNLDNISDNKFIEIIDFIKENKDKDFKDIDPLTLKKFQLLIEIIHSPTQKLLSREVDKINDYIYICKLILKNFTNLEISKVKEISDGIYGTILRINKKAYMDYKNYISILKLILENNNKKNEFLRMVIFQISSFEKLNNKIDVKDYQEIINIFCKKEKINKLTSKYDNLSFIITRLVNNNLNSEEFTDILKLIITKMDNYTENDFRLIYKKIGQLNNNKNISSTDYVNTLKNFINNIPLVKK